MQRGRTGKADCQPPALLGLYDAILVACREAGFSPQVVQEAPRMTATLSLVAAGLGVSIVPASMQRLRAASTAVPSTAKPAATA